MKENNFLIIRELMEYDSPTVTDMVFTARWLDSQSLSPTDSDAKSIRLVCNWLYKHSSDQCFKSACCEIGISVAQGRKYILNKIKALDALSASPLYSKDQDLTFYEEKSDYEMA